jgi:hypothetical protein
MAVAGCDVYCLLQHWLSILRVSSLLSFYLLPYNENYKDQTGVGANPVQTLFVVMFFPVQTLCKPCLGLLHTPTHAAGAGSFKSIEIYGPYRTSALVCVKMHLLAPKSEVHDPRIPFCVQKTGSLGLFCS